MTRIEIKNLNSFLASLKLNGFSKETRNMIIKNYVKTNKVVRETDDLVKEISDKLVSENQEAVKKLYEKREIFKQSSDEEKSAAFQTIINECQEGLKLEAELNELVNDVYTETVEIDLIKIDYEMFANECAEAGIDFTLSDLDKINILFN